MHTTNLYCEKTFCMDNKKVRVKEPLSFNLVNFSEDNIFQSIVLDNPLVSWMHNYVV